MWGLSGVHSRPSEENPRPSRSWAIFGLMTHGSNRAPGCWRTRLFTSRSPMPMRRADGRTATEKLAIFPSPERSYQPKLDAATASPSTSKTS